MRDPDYERPDPFARHDPNLPPDHQGMDDPGNDIESHVKQDEGWKKVDRSKHIIIRDEKGRIKKLK